MEIDFFGESDGIRTHDLLIKSQLLYRLSYALPGAAVRPRGVGDTYAKRLLPVNPQNEFI